MQWTVGERKKRMREVFNEAVKDGDTYEVLYA